MGGGALERNGVEKQLFIFSLSRVDCISVSSDCAESHVRTCFGRILKHLPRHVMKEGAIVQCAVSSRGHQTLLLLPIVLICTVQTVPV